MFVVDSGLGGISVVRALRATQGDMPLIYIADTAGFPYGNKSPEEITARAIRLVEHAKEFAPQSPFILACNTLSTLSLEPLRIHFPQLPFVGTVPAVKTAAQQSKTKRFTLLATPNTAASKYSQDLIAQFASGCVVDSYGAPNLAAMAEAMLLGDGILDEDLRREILPAFSDDGLGRTDIIVLGCTHYPLIVERLQPLTPWPVTFIDSGDAIARRALSLGDKTPSRSIAYVTSAQHVERYRPIFQREGFDETRAFLI